MVRHFLVALLALSAIASVAQQSSSKAPSLAPTQTAPASLTAPAQCESPKTIAALLTALDKNISGAGGRDTTCLQALFIPGARLAPVFSLKQKTAAGETTGIRPLTIEQYIDRLKASTSSFYEKQTSYKVDEFGQIAQVFSQYEIREKPDGPVTLRGVNSFHLVNDGTQWHILEVLWEPEAKDRPMPAPYK